MQDRYSLVAISTSFEGTISAESKYKPVKHGFEKYWKSKQGRVQRGAKGAGAPP
jgi:hypothetical protein